MKLNKRTCRKLAEIIKNEDIFDMLKNAKNGIKDWTVASRLNPAMSKGYAWNILASKFDVSVEHHVGVLKNILCEFGEWLTIKPYMESRLPKPKEKYNGEVCHKAPDFSNYE